MPYPVSYSTHSPRCAIAYPRSRRTNDLDHTVSHQNPHGTQRKWNLIASPHHTPELSVCRTHSTWTHHKVVPRSQTLSRYFLRPQKPPTRWSTTLSHGILDWGSIVYHPTDYSRLSYCHHLCIHLAPKYAQPNHEHYWNHLQNSVSQMVSFASCHKVQPRLYPYAIPNDGEDEVFGYMSPTDPPWQTARIGYSRMCSYPTPHPLGTSAAWRVVAIGCLLFRYCSSHSQTNGKADEHDKSWNYQHNLDRR